MNSLEDPGAARSPAGDRPSKILSEGLPPRTAAGLAGGGRPRGAVGGDAAQAAREHGFRVATAREKPQGARGASQGEIVSPMCDPRARGYRRSHHDSGHPSSGRAGSRRDDGCPRLRLDPDRIARLVEEFPEHHLWEERNLFFGGAHTVATDGRGFSGAGDPRRGGESCIV